MPKRSFEKAITNATYNLYSISLGKLISVGSRIFFFSQCRENCKRTAVRNSGVNTCGKLTLWETAAWPRVVTRRARTATWCKPRRDDYCRAWHRRFHLTTAWLSAELLRCRACNTIRSCRCIIYRDWMTDEHLAIEDQETSKIERWGRRERLGGDRQERERESVRTGNEGDVAALSGLRYCLRAQYLINSAAAKEFTLEVESQVRLGFSVSYVRVMEREKIGVSVELTLDKRRMLDCLSTERRRAMIATDRSH